MNEKTIERMVKMQELWQEVKKDGVIGVMDGMGKGLDFHIANENDVKNLGNCKIRSLKDLEVFELYHMKGKIKIFSVVKFKDIEDYKSCISGKDYEKLKAVEKITAILDGDK